MDRTADNLGTVINDIQRDLEELKTTQLRVRETLYPVGSIYMSATISSTAEVEAIFGGTWVEWGAGRVPVGVDTSDSDFDTAEETGGEKTHTLTIAEMPSHSHKVHAGWGAGSLGNNFFRVDSSNPKNQWDDTFSTGGDGAHNNLQPYITCYMFKRVS